MDSDEELRSMQPDFKSKGSHMAMVFIETVFELIMTQVGLFDIYCDLIFISIAKKEGLTDLMAVSMASIALILIPKLIANIMALMIIFGGVKEENKRRRYTYKLLIYNEFRMQAMNVEYVNHQK